MVVGNYVAQVRVTYENRIIFKTTEIYDCSLLQLASLDQNLRECVRLIHLTNLKEVLLPRHSGTSALYHWLMVRLYHPPLNTPLCMHLSITPSP